MPVQVTMLQTRRGEDGSLWTPTGSPYTASDAFAAFLIGSNLATGTLPQARQTWLTPAAANALQAAFDGGIGNAPTKSLITVMVGNSIAAALNQGPRRMAAENYWASGSDVHTALMLTGGKGWRCARMTEGTRVDRWGVYSYSGQRLDTINADLPTNFWAPILAANVLPDLIIGHSLLENDVGQGATVAQMTARLLEFIRDAQARYPSAILWLMTPRPSFSFNTPTLVANYKAITDYMLSLDDGNTIFVSHLNAYENPASPATPLAGFTDASVHPNVLGGMLLGRTEAVTLQRINRRAVLPFRSVSNNFAMIGTGAASGTNVSGTVATGVTHGGSANATSIVLTANQPSQTMAITQTAGASVDTSVIALGAATVTGLGTQFSPYIQFRIDSGAENIRLCAFRPRFGDGTTNLFFTFQAGATSDVDGGYQNGDVMTIFTPPTVQADVVGTAGPFTTIQPYLGVTRKTGGTGNVLTSGTVQITILAAGVAIVA